MAWTKQHSQNAVAAKARRRAERAQFEPEHYSGEVFRPQKPVSDFIITVRHKSGERIQLSAIRYGKQFITNEGIKSARDIGRGIELILRYA